MNEMQKVKPTNRVAEMVLGIMGSIFGILGGLFAIMLQVLVLNLILMVAM